MSGFYPREPVTHLSGGSQEFSKGGRGGAEEVLCRTRDMRERCIMHICRIQDRGKVLNFLMFETLI